MWLPTEPITNDPDWRTYCNTTLNMDETLPIFVSFDEKTNFITIDPNLVTAAFIGHTFTFNYELTDHFGYKLS